MSRYIILNNNLRIYHSPLPKSIETPVINNSLDMIFMLSILFYVPCHCHEFRKLLMLLNIYNVINSQNVSTRYIK